MPAGSCSRVWRRPAWCSCRRCVRARRGARTAGVTRGRGGEYEAPLCGSLSALGPVHLEVVRTPEQVAQWKRAVARHHPLGERGGFGYRLRYFIVAGERPLGCVMLAGAARALAVRDAWIGWDAPTRGANLMRVLNNSRFLIFPQVQVPHLASHVLGQLARRVAADWRGTGASRRCCWRPSSIRSATAAPATAPPVGRCSGRRAGAVWRAQAAYALHPDDAETREPG
jgi:hypothetical protein